MSSVTVVCLGRLETKTVVNGLASAEWFVCCCWDEIGKLSQNGFRCETLLAGLEALPLLFMLCEVTELPHLLSECSVEVYLVSATKLPCLFQQVLALGGIWKGQGGKKLIFGNKHHILAISSLRYPLFVHKNCLGFCHPHSKALLIYRHENESFIHIDIINEEAGSMLYQLTPQGKVKLASFLCVMPKLRTVTHSK